MHIAAPITKIADLARRHLRLPHLSSYLTTDARNLNNGAHIFSIDVDGTPIISLQWGK